MTPLEIKRALANKDITQGQLAVMAGLSLTSRPVVSSVINGHCRSARIESQIAKALGKPINEVFPAWYMPGGKRIRRLRYASTAAQA
jgi:transcriptional regulator with XRE-family HTH domain